MNQIETKIHDAFFNGIPLKLKHDSVLIINGCAVYQCWDTILAIRHLGTKKIIYSKGGQNTKLTRNRLNCLGAKVRIKQGVIEYIDGKPVSNKSITTYNLN